MKKETMEKETMEKETIKPGKNTTGWFKAGRFDVYIVTTRKAVIVYTNDNCSIKLGEARVNNEKDFDFNTLFKLAMHESGSQIGGA